MTAIHVPFTVKRIVASREEIHHGLVVLEDVVVDVVGLGLDGLLHHMISHFDPFGSGMHSPQFTTVCCIDILHRIAVAHGNGHWIIQHVIADTPYPSVRVLGQCSVGIVAVFGGSRYTIHEVKGS